MVKYIIHIKCMLFPSSISVCASLEFLQQPSALVFADSFECVNLVADGVTPYGKLGDIPFCSPQVLRVLPGLGLGVQLPLSSVLLPLPHKLFAVYRLAQLPLFPCACSRGPQSDLSPDSGPSFGDFSRYSLEFYQF